MSLNLNCNFYLHIQFNSDNHLGDNNNRICRDVLLPGEKFKIFIYKKS